MPSKENKSGFAPTYYLYPVGFYGHGWGTCRPTQEVYDRYDTTYDARVHWVVGGFGTDPGTETIDDMKYYKPLPLTVSNGVAYDGDYNVTKVRLLSSSNVDFYYGHYPLLRLADIYLLLAEATAHLDGDEAGREVLKAVRSRALITSRSTDVDVLQTAYRQSDFIRNYWMSVPVSFASNSSGSSTWFVLADTFLPSTNCQPPVEYGIPWVHVS